MAHGMEWVELGFPIGVGDDDITPFSEVEPNGCLGSALIASRLYVRLKGDSKLQDIFEDRIKLFQIRPEVTSTVCPALWVYLVSVEPTLAPTQISLEEITVFVAIIWNSQPFGPLPAYHPGVASVASYIRSFVLTDPNLSIIVNGQPTQLATTVKPGTETYFKEQIDDRASRLGHQMSFTYKTSIDANKDNITGQISTVVNNGG